MSSLLRLLEHELKKAGQHGTIPVGTRCLLAVLDHQLHIRDQAHGDLWRAVERLMADMHGLKSGADQE